MWKLCHNPNFICQRYLVLFPHLPWQKWSRYLTGLLTKSLSYKTVERTSTKIHIQRFFKTTVLIFHLHMFFYFSVPPTWRRPPTDVRTLEGRGVGLDCQAHGYPTPKAVWSKATPMQGRHSVASKHVQEFQPIDKIMSADSYRWALQITKKHRTLFQSKDRLWNLLILQQNHAQSKLNNWSVNMNFPLNSPIFDECQA